MNVKASRLAMLAAVDAAIAAAPAAAVKIEPVPGKVQYWKVLLTGASEPVTFRKFANGQYGPCCDRNRTVSLGSEQSTLALALLVAAGLPEAYVTITAPGCGRYKVLNTKERLQDFRAEVAREFNKPRLTANIRASRPTWLSLTCSAAERARIMSEAETL